MQGHHRLSEETPKSSNIAKSAAFIAMGTLASRVLGLVRDSLFGALFSRTVTDAWLVAFRIPNMFRRIFGEGALSVSFIPVFVDLLNPNKIGHDLDGSKKLVNGVFTLLIIILTTFTFLGIIFSEDLVRLIAGGESFLSVPGKFEMAVRMNKIMFIFVLLICLYAYAMAILNALKSFVLPAFAPVFFNIAMIGSTLLPSFSSRFTEDVLAWGVVVGGLLQFGILVPALTRAGYLPQLTKQIWSDSIKIVFQKMLPGLFGMGILQLTIVVNTRFASMLPEGTNSWIFWADRILELPLALFAVSMGTALLPTLSLHWQLNEREKMVEIFHKNLKLVLFLAIPSCIGMYVMAEPIVDLLFRRGRFDLNDLQNTALVVKIYSLGIVSYTVIRVGAQAFYAIQNTKLPAYVSAVCLGIHFFLAPMLMKSYGVGGLMASTVFSATLNMVLLLIAFHIKIGSVMSGGYFESLVNFLIAGFSMGLFTKSFFYISSQLPDSDVVQGSLTLVYVFMSGILYFAVSFILKTPEAQPVWQRIRSRIFKQSIS